MQRRKCTKNAINEVILYATASIKYLGINLTKGLNALYIENFKTLNKFTEGYTRRWKNLPHLRLSRINSVKILFYQKQSTDLTKSS